MSGGQRTLAHNQCRDEIFNLASTALLNPQKEAHPFANSQRIDLVLHTGFPKTMLLDLAITHALARSNLREALSAPGGAATAYEQVKVSEYGSSVLPHQTLCPLVVDTFGAWGNSAVPVLAKMAHNFARRSMLGRWGVSEFYTRLNTRVMRSVADLLLLNSQE